MISEKKKYDVVIVGAGPNGLAAAIALAKAGRAVLVLEAAEKIGGGARTYELTLPGYLHDPCATIFGTAQASPYFRSLPLEEYGVEWVYAPVPLAHPLDDGPAVILERSVEETARGLGADEQAYRRLMGPLARNWEKVANHILSPFPNILPDLPLMAFFGLNALQTVQGLAKLWFKTEKARALFAGLGSHSMLALDMAGSAAFGLMLGMTAHTTGWGIVKGGAQNFSDALGKYFCSLGGEIITGVEVRSMDDLPPSRQVIFDLTPRQVLRIAGNRFSPRYTRQLQKYRYGMGVFKVDWALDGPIPWSDPAVARAMVVHIGGTLEEIAASEKAAWDGVHEKKPFILLAQPSSFDLTRAPQGKHTIWAYCHSPHASTLDRTDEIENQVERFAPGFKKLILSRSTRSAVQMESYNPNYVGGDINGGAQHLAQMFTRPVVKLNPYQTSDPSIFLCSSSTPPGGGVHGMCGYNAAQAALKADGDFS